MALASTLRYAAGVTAYKISSFCSGGGCVEVGHSPADGTVVIRDAKDPLRRVAVVVTERVWGAFLDGVRRGDFAQPS